MIDEPIFGPKPIGHPSLGTPCAYCGSIFMVGDYTVLREIVPADEAQRQQMLAGHSYNAQAHEVHYICPDARDRRERLHISKSTPDEPC